MKSRTLLAAAALAVCTTAASAVELLVPAYFYPSFDPLQSQWDEMTAALAGGARITAIMNPDNGPGAALNSDYVAAVNAFRAAGGRVLGYVYTCYGGTKCADGLPTARTTADVLADVQRYATWYPVDGIFLDEMATTASELPFYQAVAGALRSAHAGWQIVGNPGTATPADYLAVADTLVTFEGSGAAFAGRATAPWMASAAPARQAHLFHGVATVQEALALMGQATAANAGYVYLTDDLLQPNPWDRLPTYWNAEVAAAAVPEPATALLGAAGALLLALRRRLFRQAGAPA